MKEIFKHSLLVLALVLIFPKFNIAQSQGTVDLNAFCVKAGFTIEPRVESFDLYRYQKAFLNFERLDNFRLNNAKAVYLIENGEAILTLFSITEMKTSHEKKIEPTIDSQPAIHFILNVNGQVKEQPLN